MTLTRLSQHRHSRPSGHILLGCGGGALLGIKEGLAPCPALGLSPPGSALPPSFVPTKKTTSVGIAECPQGARTSVFILQMRRPRPREAEGVPGALSEAGITPGLSCLEASVLSIRPSGAGHPGISHWQAQSLCPGTAGVPAAAEQCQASDVGQSLPKQPEKHLLTRWPSLGSITNDKSYLLIICDFWGQPRFPFRDKYFLGDSFPPPTQLPPPQNEKRSAGEPRQLRSATGPAQPF